MKDYNEIQLIISWTKGITLHVPTSEFVLVCIGILILSIAGRFFASSIVTILRCMLH